MKNFYLDTFQIHDWQLNPNGIYITNYDGLEFPELRLQSYNRPGEHGGFLANNLYGQRLITLEGIIFGNTLAAFELQKRAFEASLGINKNSSGQYQPITLKFTTMDDLALQVSVGVQKYSTKLIKALHAITFQLMLLAPDYMLYSQDLVVVSIGKSIGGGVVIPAIFPMVLGASVGGSQVVTNNGNAESYPLIYIHGPATNPTMQNVANGRFLTINATLVTGETLAVDMRERTILKGSQSLFSSKSDPSQFWWLNSGNNTAKFATTSSSDTGTMEMQYRHGYLGT